MPELDSVKAWEALQNARFEIEGDDQFGQLRAGFATNPEEADDKKKLVEKWSQALKNLRIRIGTLLKTDGVSILLGSGASKEAGGVLIRAIPKEVEESLRGQGIVAGRVRKWLRVFYLALRREAPDVPVPVDRAAILARSQALTNGEEIKVNLEAVLSLLHRWRAAIPEVGGRLSLDGDPPVDAQAETIDECLRRTKLALAAQCVLPTGENGPHALLSYRSFLKKLLTRPLNLRRVNLFTLNYDTLVEKAADSEGVVLLDGFVGTLGRVFRPESYDQDLYFPADTTEGRVHRLDRVAHLYKLHGSLTWRSAHPAWDNPYGVSMGGEADWDVSPPLIYPTPTKYGETLGMPYAELFRRFAAAVVRPQSTLFTVGYGFGDDHVNVIIRQALAVPSFTLVIVDPCAPAADPRGGFVAKLRARPDRRAWILSGETLGKFSSFVEEVLPDLRDEEILTKVAATYRSLGTPVPEDTAGGGMNGQ